MKQFLSVILIFLFASGQLIAAPSSIGQVAVLNGNATAQLGNEPKRVLAKGSPIYKGDLIAVADNSQALIQLLDGTMVSFRSNTEYQVNLFEYSPGKDTNEYLSTLFKGGCRILAGNIAGGSPEQYQVKTPVATIGVRGTEFELYYEDGELDCAVIEGQIIVRNQLGSSVISSREYAVTLQNRAPQRVTTIPRGLHTIPRNPLFHH